MPDFSTTFPWAAHLQRLQQELAGHAPWFDGDVLSPAGSALEQLLLAGQALAKAEADVVLVADELRRYQKFSPAGRPSLQIVQLRRQQSGVQQAQRVARQAFIRCADAFARALQLEVPAKLGTVTVVERWLQANLR